MRWLFPKLEGRKIYPQFTVPVMSAFFLSQQRAATAGCHQCRIPLCQPGSLGDCFMQSVACLEVSLSPPPWLFPGAKLALGRFLPPVNAIHSSVPNKTLLFCLCRGPCFGGLDLLHHLWSEVSPLGILAPHPVCLSWDLVTFPCIMVQYSSFAEDGLYILFFVLRWFLKESRSILALPFWNHSLL